MITFREIASLDLKEITLSIDITLISVIRYFERGIVEISRITMFVSEV